MKTNVRMAALAVAALAIIAAGCVQPAQSGSGNAWTIDGPQADPAITSENQYPSVAYAPTSAARGQLAVVFHGTGASPQAHFELYSALRADGYHVIGLRYSASVGTQAACPDDVAATFPDCHREARSETVFGAGVTDPDGNSYDHPGLNISQANSVYNRLAKLVEWLDTKAPAKGWGQFQQSTGGTCDNVHPTYDVCDLDWSKISAVGHSQGAGVALYLGKFFQLNAIGLLSGSFDAFDDGGGVYTVAPWITEGGMDTPASDIRSLTHLGDYSLERILAVHNALGIPGADVSATLAPPYASNRLITNLASTCPWDGAPGHNSTAVDLCTPDHAYVNAWKALAGS